MSRRPENQAQRFADRYRAMLHRRDGAAARKWASPNPNEKRGRPGSRRRNKRH